MGTSLTVERYAEMRAEMEAGKLRDEVLARAGLGSQEWIEAQSEWLQRMGSEIELGRFELSNRYTRAFLERQQAIAAANVPEPVTRRAERQPAPSEGPLPLARQLLEAPLPVAHQPFAAPLPTSPRPAPAPAPVAPLPQAPLPQAPLPLAAPPQPEPPRIAAMGLGRRAAPLGQTMPGVERASGPALPFQPKAAGAAAPRPASPQVAPREQSPSPKKPTTLDTTLDPTRPVEPALPFGKPGPNAKPSSPPPGRAPSDAPPGPRPRPPAALAQTMFGEVEPTGPALPFDTTGASRPKQASSAAREAPAPQPAPPVRAPSAMGSTVALGPEELARIRAGLVVPFAVDGSSPASLPPETKPVAPAARSGSSPPPATPFEAPGRPRSGAPPAAGSPPEPRPTPRTTALPVAGMAPEPSPRAGRDSAPPAGSPVLSLEQVAGLVEELAGAPNAATVLAYYGLTSAQFQALEQQWTERMRQNPAEIQRLASAREAYRAAKAARR